MIQKVNMITVQDWDAFIEEVYGKPYRFQQQDGCRDKGVYELKIPSDDYPPELPESIPEDLRTEEMMVDFESWLARDPEKPVGEDSEKWAIKLFWYRNFYPNIDVLAEDLLKRGLIEAGTYYINIDW